MTPAEFTTAIARTRLDPASRSARAAWAALVDGLTVYRAALQQGITQAPVHLACRKILAASILTHCPECGQELPS